MESTNNLNQSEKIKSLLSYLNKNLYGKEEAIRLALLSAVAGESIFFMGPPGTAKSMISRRIAKAFSDVDDNQDYFEYLMNEFSTPDEICGPVSLRELNNDKYIRLTDGYLPKAKIAFLDEIWKSGPAILNTLLTLINEKKFHNGGKVEKVPLVSLAAASNELPSKNRGLEALWDRFTIRVYVDPVTTRTDFFKLVESSANELEPIFNSDNLLQINQINEWQEQIEMITLPENIKDVIMEIRKEMIVRNQEENRKDDEKYYVSDRRWKKIVHILKTSAFLNGRDSVDLMDLTLIKYCIWNTDLQHIEAEDIINNVLKQNKITVNTLFEELDKTLKRFEKKVEDTWFEIINHPEQDRIVDIEGMNCYECVHEKGSDKNIYYITVEPVETRITRFGSVYFHQIFNNKNQSVGVFEMTKDSNTISLEENGSSVSYKINQLPESRSLELKKLDEKEKENLFIEFEANVYKPILDGINNEISIAKKEMGKASENFTNNFFTDTKYCKILLQSHENIVKELEYKKVEVEKYHSRYAK